jgi:hypothetical protein
MGRRIIASAAALGGICAASCFLPKFQSKSCKERGAAFNSRVESIKKDAQGQLKIGTKREEVSRFFKEHGIPFRDMAFEVEGTLNTDGCSPRGCGADSAQIDVHVKLDQAGAVSAEPTVVAMYTDCI